VPLKVTEVVVDPLLDHQGAVGSPNKVDVVVEDLLGRSTGAPT